MTEAPAKRRCQRGRVKPGDRFGCWLVLQVETVTHPVSGRRRNVAYCTCDCGNSGKHDVALLAGGWTKKCLTCANREKRITHGDASRSKGPRARLFRVWTEMNHRCRPGTRRTNRDYHDRGIRVCTEWMSSYASFKAWAMANGYRDDLSIDRKGNNGPYSPNNCRWVTCKEQARNRRSNRLVTAFGVTKTLVEWCEDSRCKVSAGVFCNRMKKGWSAEVDLTTPRQGRASYV